MEITDRPPEPPTSANDAQRRYLARQQPIMNAPAVRYEIEIDPANEEMARGPSPSGGGGIAE
jgi:hypothetical protein